jgi:predicted ATPase
MHSSKRIFSHQGSWKGISFQRGSQRRMRQVPAQQRYLGTASPTQLILKNQDGPLKRYEGLTLQNRLHRDPFQHQVVERLQSMYDQVVTYFKSLNRPQSGKGTLGSWMVGQH